jgi:hypothetical protein
MGLDSRTAAVASRSDAPAGLNPERVVAEAAAAADEVGREQLTLAAVAPRFGVALPSLAKQMSGLDGLSLR